MDVSALRIGTATEEVTYDHLLPGYCVYNGPLLGFLKLGTAKADHDKN